MCTTKTGNKTFQTTSTIETVNFGHCRFFKCSPYLFKIRQNYDICIFSRHIIDEKLNFVLKFFHRKYCMQICCQIFSLRILRAKILEKFTEISLEKTTFCEFFQIFSTIS